MSRSSGSLPAFTSVMTSPPNFSPLVNSFRQTRAVSRMSPAIGHRADLFVRYDAHSAGKTRSGLCSDSTDGGPMRSLSGSPMTAGSLPS